MNQAHPAAPAIVAIGTALPPHYAAQDELLAAFREHWGEAHFNMDRLEQLHRSVRVGGRHLALPLAEYVPLESFAQRNAAWTRVAAEVGERAVRVALDGAGLDARDVDQIFFVTVTGVATPSIEARLAVRMGMRPDVKRIPIFGLGCVAGAAGLARASDALRGFPDNVAVLLSVELCSLTLQRDDLSVANLIASGLFGDGAAAAVLVGAGHPLARRDGTDAMDRAIPRILATRSVLYPDTERVMGWDVVDSGFKVVLSAQVPAVVRKHLRSDVDAFLASLNLGRRDIRHLVCHTGGPKVLEAVAESLELPPEALAGSWRSLAEVGNLSSASVLFVLGDLLRSGEARAGDLGLLVALGPGFCSELVLLQW